MSIWIILKNLVLTYRECNFCQYWDIQLCIHPCFLVKINGVIKLCFIYKNLGYLFHKCQLQIDHFD